MAAIVDAYVAALDPARRFIVEQLRALLLAVRHDVTEHLKWNAPSYCVEGEDRITLGLDAKGGVRVVLHRGAKPKDLAGFQFVDPSGLVRWAAPDRGILLFRTEEDVTGNREILAELFTRWLDATGAP
jgi:hypothetical protein